VLTFGKIDSLGYDAESVADGGLNSPMTPNESATNPGLTPPFADDFGDP
jgi:hypothetical protein